MYQALYRKYRPQTFSDVVGQRSITETLRAQLTGGRLSHAYLFTGTRGTGKTSCAKILAKAVNCLDPQNGDPCGHCAACQAIDSGSCMDVLEIDAASNNGVDSVRVLRDDAVYTPGEVRMRVYIIDEVHMLSTAAFNALLKIIEEPPPHLLFILATTELHKVPATILSRCQRFSFRRLTQEDIAGRLNYVAYQENIELDGDAAQLLARLADGALRDGLSLLDQCAASVGNAPVTAESVERALGLAGSAKTARLLGAIADQDASAALSLFSELYASGKDLSAMLDEMASLSRDLLILKTAPKSGAGMLTGICGQKEALALQERFSPPELLRMTELLQKTRQGFSRSGNRRVDTELCLLQLCQPQLSQDFSAYNARLGRVEEQLASGVVVRSSTGGDGFEDDRPPFPDDADDPFAAQPPQPEPEQTAAQKQPQQELSFWPELSAKIREGLSPIYRGYFEPNGPIQPFYNDNTLTLAANSQFDLDQARKVESVVREKAMAFLGPKTTVRFALKGQVDQNGADPMDALLRFGGEHSDIFTIQ